MFTSLPVFVLSFLYCVWAHYRHGQLQRARVLRRRVAYLLWVVAHEVNDGAALVATRRPPYARKRAPSRTSPGESR